MADLTDRLAQVLDAYDRRRTGFPLDYETETAILETAQAALRPCERAAAPPEAPDRIDAPWSLVNQWRNLSRSRLGPDVREVYAACANDLEQEIALRHAVDAAGLVPRAPSGEERERGFREGVEAAAKAADAWAEHYPADVFTEGGNSMEAAAGRMARHVCVVVAKQVRSLAPPPRADAPAK